MWTIIKRSLKDYKTPLIIFSLSSIGFLWMYIAMFPSIAKESAKMTELVKNYPDAMFKAFGIDPNQLTFSSIESFISMEHFSLVWPIMAIAMAVSLAGGAIAGEIEKGTMAILLSQPISRLNLFFSKYLMGLISITIFTALSIFLTLPLAKIHNVAHTSESYPIMFALGILFALAIYSLAFLFSSIFSEKGKVVFVTLGIVILMYALKIVSSLKESLTDLKYSSFFYYYNQNAALVDHRISNESIIAFSSVIIICTILAAIIFSKRDVAV